MNYKINKERKAWEMAFFEWFVIFAIATSLILLERFTALEINNSYVRLLLYIISASLLCFWIGWILFGFKAVKKRLLIFFSVAALICLKAYLTWGGDWKTQTILYANKQSNSRTIEFQMRGDWYAFGYKKRIVERKKIIPFFDLTYDVDTTKLDKTIWKRIDKKVNALKLKNFNDTPSN